MQIGKFNIRFHGLSLRSRIPLTTLLQTLADAIIATQKTKSQQTLG